MGPQARQGGGPQAPGEARKRGREEARKRGMGPKLVRTNHASGLRCEEHVPLAARRSHSNKMPQGGARASEAMMGTYVWATPVHERQHVYNMANTQNFPVTTSIQLK